MLKIGELPERPNGADCKSADLCLRWFESTTPHGFCAKSVSFFRSKQFNFAAQKFLTSGSSSVGRAIAFQAIGRGFEPRLPLGIG